MSHSGGKEGQKAKGRYEIEERGEYAIQEDKKEEEEKEKGRRREREQKGYKRPNRFAGRKEIVSSDKGGKGGREKTSGYGVKEWEERVPPQKLLRQRGKCSLETCQIGREKRRPLASSCRKRGKIEMEAS